MNMEYALKELEEALDKLTDANLAELSEFDIGYQLGLTCAIDVLARFVITNAAHGISGPSKRRLKELSDMMFVLGSKRGQMELLDIAEKFGV
jgi:hypothetical protein